MSICQYSFLQKQEGDILKKKKDDVCKYATKLNNGVDPMWQEHRYRHFSFELSSEVRNGWERTTGRLAYPAVVDLRRAHNLTFPSRGGGYFSSLDSGLALGPALSNRMRWQYRCDSSRGSLK